MRPGTLTVIGVGHSESVALGNVSALVTGRSGRRLLIDAGPRVKPALQQFSLLLEDIDGVFISHLHGDASFGLERFAFESTFRYERRHALVIHESMREMIWDGFLQTFVGESSRPPTTLDQLFEVRTVSERFDWDGIDVELVEAAHGTPAVRTFGLALNGSVLWLSDTTPVPKDVRGFSTLFHDMTTRAESPVHSTRQALLEAYPEDVRAQMWLVGYEDDSIGRRDELGAGFAGLAWPGQTVDL